MCEFSFIYLHDLAQETPKDMKRGSVNRNRSFKEPVPKRAKVASNIQGHYFFIDFKGFFIQMFWDTLHLKRVHAKTTK